MASTRPVVGSSDTSAPCTSGNLPQRQARQPAVAPAWRPSQRRRGRWRGTSARPSPRRPAAPHRVMRRGAGPGLPSFTGRAQATSDKQQRRRLPWLRSPDRTASRASRAAPRRRSPPAPPRAASPAACPGGRAICRQRPGPVLRQRRPAVEMRDRPAPAAQLAVVRHQSVAHRPLRGGLQRRVQAGAHHQPALRRHVGAELRDQLAAHLLGEPVGARDRRAAGGIRAGTIGSAFAAVAWAAVMTWSSAIRSSTQSRRAFAASGT